MKKYKVYILLTNRMKSMFPYLSDSRLSETDSTGNIISLYAISFNKKYVKKFLKIRDSSMFIVKELDVPEEILSPDEALYRIEPYVFNGSNKKVYVTIAEQMVGNENIIDASTMDNLVCIDKGDTSLTSSEKNIISIYMSINKKDAFDRWMKYYSPTLDLKRLYKYLI